MISRIAGLFIVCLLMRPPGGSSQTRDPHEAQPERPTIATHAGTVEKGWLLWTLSFGGEAIGSIGWVAELYGFPGTSGPAGKAPTSAALFGPTLTVRPWLVLDAGLIVSVVGPQPFALYLGGVWNIGQIWE